MGAFAFAPPAGLHLYHAFSASFHHLQTAGFGRLVPPGSGQLAPPAGHLVDRLHIPAASEVSEAGTPPEVVFGVVHRSCIGLVATQLAAPEVAVLPPGRRVGKAGRAG